MDACPVCAGTGVRSTTYTFVDKVPTSCLRCGHNQIWTSATVFGREICELDCTEDIPISLLRPIANGIYDLRKWLGERRLTKRRDAEEIDAFMQKIRQRRQPTLNPFQAP